MPTPTPSPDHPAQQLSRLLNEDFRLQLLKVPYHLPLESEIYQARLTDLRNNWKFGYVIQWCYLFKGVIKINDHFDIDSFEEELLQLNPPSFLTRLKCQLIHSLTGKKISDSYVEETGEFEDSLKEVIPQYFLDKYKTDEEIEEFQFFKLNLNEQIDIYYQLIELVNNKEETLRKFIDNKYDKQMDLIKPTSVYVVNDGMDQLEYLILPDLRLYLKKITFGKVDIPRKKADMDEILKTKTVEELIDESEPVITEFTCLSTNIYEFDEFVNSHGKTSALHKALKVYYDEIAENDIKRRKQELARQRQIKLQSLLVHRKRSSRLEEKEKKKMEDDERERLQYEANKRAAIAERAAKRMKLRGDGFDSREGSEPVVSRDERYRRKHGDIDHNSATETPEFEPTSLATDGVLADAVDIVMLDADVKEETTEPVSEVAESAPTVEPVAEPVAEQPAAVLEAVPVITAPVIPQTTIEPEIKPEIPTATPAESTQPLPSVLPSVLLPTPIPSTNPVVELTTESEQAFPSLN